MGTLPAVDVHDLDLVMASHLHSDHFDRCAVERLDQALEVVAPASDLARLRDWGFERARALDWQKENTWQRNGEQLRVAAIPAHHSHDQQVSRNLGTVNGYLIEHRMQGSVFRDLLDRRHGLVRRAAPRSTEDAGRSICSCHTSGRSGKTGRGGSCPSMPPREPEMVNLFHPRTVIPIHHTTFTHYVEPISLFAEQLLGRGSRGELVILKEGESWGSHSDARGQE